ncbi:MAG: hypothetical protein HRU76_13760 [Phycisphaeraceae bacterium]|nr:hypothetical protein [Phycisphaerales bacterium]QOJ18585.1 MAG: hypothetical protein HRU76_13760 [Phycisphaeraceae bacterium]
MSKRTTDNGTQLSVRPIGLAKVIEYVKNGKTFRHKFTSAKSVLYATTDRSHLVIPARTSSRGEIEDD